MYFRLAWKNVRKSFKDYSIYFLTLTFGVCIFYAFNSIGTQKVIHDLNQSQMMYLDDIKNIIGIVSVFVSFILAALILYGNNFLIKKRQKEMGIYLTLGMSKNKLSYILFLETLMIGIMALGMGLILGVIGSQFFSLWVARLFLIDLSRFAFSFSLETVIRTMCYFSIIFIMVMILNTFMITKYQLIDLLQAHHKNEVIQGTSGVMGSIVFWGAIIFIGGAYYLVKQVGLNIEDSRFGLSIVLGVLGTYGFFFGLSGWLRRWFYKHPKIRFKGTNLFVMGQLQRRMHTNIFSMTVICLMLFLTITGLSTGMSFKASLEKSLETTTPFDATAIVYLDEGDTHVGGILETMKSLGISFEESEAYAIYYEYYNNRTLGDLLGDRVGNFAKIQMSGVALSEYNAQRILKGEESVVLEPGEARVLSNQEKVIPYLEKLAKAGESILWQDQAYTIQDHRIYKETLASTGFTDNFITVILPDEALEGAEPVSEVMNIMYGPEESDQSEEKFKEFFLGVRQGEYKGIKLDYDKYPFIIGETKLQIYEGFQAGTVMILFIGVYLGVVFLISSAAVLALQQLSEASDSLERYKVLSKIGVSEEMKKKSIFLQTGLYFMLPLGLAIIHSIVGIIVANDFIKLFNKPDLLLPSLITMLLLAGIYGGYFYMTYVGYKNIIKNK